MLKGKNNAYGSLYEAITSTDTTCKIVKPNTFTQGTSIEVPFMLTFYDRSMSDIMLNIEIVKVTAIEQGITFDTFTIERAQENTAALNHGAGKACGNLITRGYFEDAFNDSVNAKQIAQESHDIAIEASNDASDALSQVGNKVDKISGKGLSTNDYDNTEKQTVADTKTEVINARQSTVKGKTFGNLKERYEEIEQEAIANNLNLLKADQEMTSFRDTITQANVNQEAKVTTNGYGPLLLPKNAANSNMPVSIKGNTAMNIVKNGNFSNGTTGWGGTGGTGSVLNNVYTQTCNGAANGGQVYQNTGIKASSGRRVYVFSRIRVTNSNSTNIAIMVESVGGSYITVKNIASPTNNVWYDLYGIAVFSTHTGDIFVNNRHFYADAVIASGKAMEVREVIVIDMGSDASNPDFNLTAEQMNTKYPTWFDGIKNTQSACRIKSVGKNLFDKNKAKNGYYLNSAGEEVLAANHFITDYIKVKSGFEYIGKSISTSTTIYLVYYDKNKSILSTVKTSDIWIASATVKTTIPQGAYYIRISCAYSGDVETAKTILQIEQSATATIYEPYTESNLYIPNVGELRSLPNGVRDEIVGNKNIKRVSNSINISGNVGWLSNGETTNTYEFRYANDTVNVDASILVRCSDGYFPYSSSGIDGRCIIPTAGYIKIRVEKYKIDAQTGSTTIDKLKAFLNTYPLTINYRLITSIEATVDISGVLLSNPSGTVYHEKVVADAGIYNSGINVLNTTLPIASIENISKIDYTTGAETILNVSQAVIAGNGLSFTHPSLAKNDIVFFTYLYSTESTTPEVGVTYYDSRHVLKDTVTGKFYKIVPTVTNGVLINGLVEV